MRLHMCQVYVCTAQDVVLCVGQASLPVSCSGCFVAGALRRSHTEGRQPSHSDLRSGTPGRTVGEVEDLRKDALVCNRVVWLALHSCVRVPPRALGEAAESRRAVAHVPGVRVYCTGCGAVRGASVSSCVVFWLFCGGGLTRKDGSLPTLRGGPLRSRRTSHSDRPPRRPCRESPGMFVLSLSHSLECSRQWVVNPSARLPWIALRSALLSSRTRVSCLIKRQRCWRVDHRWWS